MSSQLSLLQDLVTAAKKAGADAADAVAISNRSVGVSWRAGRLEDIEGSEEQDLGLRVIIGKRQAMTSSSDWSPKALSELVERTVDMARAVPEDPYCGLAPEKALLRGDSADLDLADPDDVSAETLKQWAAEAEATALDVEGVTQAEGASASASRGSVALASSHGVASSFETTSVSASVSAVAGSGTSMERDYDFSAARYAQDLAPIADIGRNAGLRAVARLGATQPNSGGCPVVFAPRVANSLIGHFLSAINGMAVARGTSFLKDQMDQSVFSSGITVIDDPLIKRGQRSKPVDGEGVATRVTPLAEDGILKSWLLNAASARQLNLPLTGHATRGTNGPPGSGSSNVFGVPGTLSPDELISDIAHGVYVTELIGMGVNAVTGDYSRGAAGFLIENGQIGKSVNEMTIAGNLKDMFKQMTVASDLEMKYAVNMPTTRVDGMTIAGR